MHKIKDTALLLASMCVILVGCLHRQETVALTEKQLMRIAVSHVKNDKALSKKIGGQPIDEKRMRLIRKTKNACVVNLFYGSLAYDTLWIVTVEMTSDGRILSTKADLHGFE